MNRCSHSHDRVDQLLKHKLTGGDLLGRGLGLAAAEGGAGHDDVHGGDAGHGRREVVVVGKVKEDGVATRSCACGRVSGMQRVSVIL